MGGEAARDPGSFAGGKGSDRDFLVPQITETLRILCGKPCELNWFNLSYRQVHRKALERRGPE